MAIEQKSKIKLVAVFSSLLRKRTPASNVYIQMFRRATNLLTEVDNEKIE